MHYNHFPKLKVSLLYPFIDRYILQKSDKKMQAVTDLWRILPIFWTINFLLRVNLKLIVTKCEQQWKCIGLYVCYNHSWNWNSHTRRKCWSLIASRRIVRTRFLFSKLNFVYCLFFNVILTVLYIRVNLIPLYLT